MSRKGFANSERNLNKFCRWDKDLSMRFIERKRVLNLFQESTKEYKTVLSKPLSTDPRLCTPLIVLLQLCQGLAKSIAWDGEGATVLIEVQVTGARTEAEAATVAKSVVGSSLTKVL